MNKILEKLAALAEKIEAGHPESLRSYYDGETHERSTAGAGKAAREICAFYSSEPAIAAAWAILLEKFREGGLNRLSFEDDLRFAYKTSFENLPPIKEFFGIFWERGRLASLLQKSAPQVRK